MNFKHIILYIFSYLIYRNCFNKLINVFYTIIQFERAVLIIFIQINTITYPYP